MKINSLLESQTVSSAISNTTSSAPEFGRDDDKLEETTTSGAMASDATAMGGMQRRGKGSMLKGIKTSSKFPNSKTVKEAGIGSVTVDMPTKPQGNYHDQEMDFYNNEIDDLAIQADPEFKAWIQSAEEKLVASEYARKNTEHLAKVLSAQQFKKFGSKTLGQKLGNAVAGKTYAYYTPEIKAIMDGPVVTAGNIIARRNELANNIDYVKQTWNRMSEDDRQKWAASVDMSYEQLEHVVRTGEMPNQQVSKTDTEQKLSETPTLADIRRHATPKSAENQQTWDALSPEEKAKAIQMGQAGAKSNTPVGETKKANTKTARKEFGKRPRAELSDKEKEQKKSDSDRLWDMLQAHIAQAEKEKQEKLDEVNPQNFDSDEDYYDAVEADDLDLDKFGNGWDIPDEIAVLRNQLRHTTSQYARAQIENKIKRYEDIYYGEDSLEEASKSKAQFRTMAAVAHNPKFAKKVGISQKVGKEFHSADKKQDYKDLPAKVDEEGKGLWANIHAKRDRIKSGSGERMRKPGSKGAPSAQDFKDAANEAANPAQQAAIAIAKKKEKGVDEARVGNRMSDISIGSPKIVHYKGKAVGEVGLDHEASPGNGPYYMKHYLTGKDMVGYDSKQDALADLKHLVMQYEGQQGVAEEKEKGADGKACWDGYRYNGTEDGKDSCVKVSEAEFTEDKIANQLYQDLQIFKKGVDKDIGSKAKDKDISKKAKDRDIIAKEGFDGEYDDEAGMSTSNLLTTARAVKGLIDTIDDRDNLPEWVQEKIAKAEQMLVTSWDYLLSQKEQGIDPELAEDWQKVNKRDNTDGMSKKAVKAYRRENPGSKLKTAVTTKPSKLKKGSKAAKRRKSFCARMSGMKKAHASAKTKRDPDSPINKALRRWNCESVEQLQELVMIAEQKIKGMKK